MEFGPVDILVNNAGLIPSFSFNLANPKDVERVINVNITSHLWVCILIHNVYTLFIVNKLVVF